MAPQDDGVHVSAKEFEGGDPAWRAPVVMVMNFVNSETKKGLIRHIP